jgi:penicillin-binding protein 1A
MLAQEQITRQEYRNALESPIELIPRDSSLYNYGIAPYFTEMIRQELSVEGTLLGFDYLEDGLQIHTTLDARMQEFAERAVKDHFTPFQSAYRHRFIARSMKEIALALYDSTVIDEDGEVLIPLDTLMLDSLRIDSMYSRRSIVQIAMVVLDPHNGDILAMIGGRDFAKSKFNRAVQAIRQPGSIFKPFTYVTAIDNGYPTTFELLNQDVVIINDDGTRWVPQNYDHSHGGLTTLREALRRSLNLIAVRLVQEVVPSKLVRRYAQQMGISTRIAAVDAIALGASGVYPIEMTAAFSAFGNGGILCTPRGLLSVEDRFGDEISSYPAKRKVALSQETAYIMTDMLSTVINRGTGGSSRWKWHFYKTAAGKTGTTNDYTDAWFVGFTPNLACGVWVGLDDPSESLGRGQSGATAALPIWANFMKMAYDSLDIEDMDFEIPSGIVELTVCGITKEIATPYCPTKLEEVFRKDAQPQGMCPQHKKVKGWN